MRFESNYAVKYSFVTTLYVNPINGGRRCNAAPVSGMRNSRSFTVQALIAARQMIASYDVCCADSWEGRCEMI